MKIEINKSIDTFFSNKYFRIIIKNFYKNYLF